jgi:hypothetical protein
VTIVARDEFGNTATSYVGLVHFTSSDPRATLPPDSPLVQGGGGFAVTLVTAGNQTIAATDARVPSLAGTSGPVSVPLPVPRFLLGRGLRATLGKDNMFVVPGVSAQCPVGAPTGCRMTGSAIAAGSRPRAARRPAAQMLATAVSLKLTGGETRSVVMRLTRAGALRLRKQGSAKLTATITLRVVGGPSRAVTRTFTLRTRTVPPR